MAIHKTNTKKSKLEPPKRSAKTTTNTIADKPLKKSLPASRVKRNRYRVAVVMVFVAIIGVATLFFAHAATPSVVTLQGNKLYVNGVQFPVRGVNYNPIATGSDKLDTAAATVDIPKIKALGANTVGTYWLGKAEYAQYSDLTDGDQMYNTLMPAAEQNGLKVIVGYFSNHTIDWTNATRVAKVTSQYQELITKAKTSPATLMYLIGNETFEKLPNDAQRVAYAQWIGNMTNWTHQNDPNHPVTYADPADTRGLAWLKTYAPNIDIYSINNYTFTTPEQLKSQSIDYANKWPGKPNLVHEWGADSLNYASGQEDPASQAINIQNLARAVDTVSADPTAPMIGGVNFEFADDWHIIGAATSQDKDFGFGCPSCFDGQANEDYWGLMKATPMGGASGRVAKPAYTSLQSYWGGSTTTIPAPTPDPSPTPNPTPTPADTTLPVVSITSPLNNAVVAGKINIDVNAKDNVGVTSVTWYLDGVKKSSDSSAPYHFTFDTKKLSLGGHTISAIAADAANNKGTASITVKK